MTTKEYISRLKQLSDSNKEILQRISKLSKLVPLEDERQAQQQQQQQDEGETRLELSEDIHESLKELESEFELFRQEAEDITGSGSQRRRDTEKENERILLITQIERFEEDLKDSRASFRRAQLQAKRAEEETQRKRARDQLFASVEQRGNGSGEGKSATGRKRREENRTQDDVILNAAGDVTAGLRRTHQLMTQELERSRFAHETLQKSTAALNSLHESYSGLDDLLKSSRSLISTLVSSQKSDTWYLETALKIGIATLIWLVFRRWFYGPILYLVYRPSRFMLSAVYSVLNLTLGVLTGTVFKLGGDADSVAAAASSSTSRAPLIIKPSASGGLPKFKADRPAPSVKVGLGGGGEAEGRSPEEKRKDEESYYQWVAQMAEEAKNQEKQYAGGESDGAPVAGQEGAAGGEGTVLRERRPDEPVNRKKRMMEEPPGGPGGAERVGGEGSNAKDEL